jgi:hypothetical protein
MILADFISDSATRFAQFGNLGELGDVSPVY